jgi:hypothetical protein
LDSTAGKKEARATVAVGGTAGLHGGGVTGDRLERCFDVLKLTVGSQGGVGEDGKAGGDVSEALEGWRWARNGVERAAVLAPMEASEEEGRRAEEERLRCGMLRGWRCPFIGPGEGCQGGEGGVTADEGGGFNGQVNRLITAG